MKRLIILLALASLMVAGGAIAGDGNRLKTFGDADVTVTDHTNVTISVGPGEYGGVYVGKAGDAKLGKAHYSFKSRGDVQGGAPRWSLPIDTDGARSTVEGYAFLDAANCGAAVGDNPGNISTTVSVDNNDCKVFYGSGTYANWYEFRTMNPSYQMAKAIPFVISDVQGEYDLRNVKIK